ncbi:MAG: hypothetical protein Q8T09_19090 [Candidatus Melainabacteria bacterium]|nr:hypothetical protein [Candidatus Melainabacteria bacterium]
MRNAPNNRIAKMALNVALVSCLFGQTVTLPAMAQYSLQAETDSFLPPEVVPLDPAVAQKMSQAQAQARQESANNANSYGQNSAMSGNPAGGNDAGMNNSGMNNFNNQNNSQQARQDMMNNMMSQNGMNQGNMGAQPNFQSSMGGQEVPGNTGTSDWIMPGQDQSAPMTAYGNVSQTQTLSAPPSNPIVRRSSRRSGMGTAVSALAGFGAGAMVGTMIRRPNSLYGLGAAGLMMTGFGTRNAFRF